MLDAIVIDLDVPPAVVVNADVAAKVGQLVDLDLGLVLKLGSTVLANVDANAAVVK